MAPPIIELRVLGSIDLWSPDAREVSRVLAQPKRLAVLTYLSSTRPVSYHRRDTLLALFWPDLDQEHARSALRNTLHFLRRELDDRVIATRGDAVSIDPGVLSCDLVSFELALERGEFESAMAMYRGDLLRGLHVSAAPDFMLWLEGERDRLRRRARDASWSIASAHEATGQLVSAAHWMRVALDLYPDDENGLRRVLRALDASGDLAGALREYERFSKRLVTEFELEPSQETRTLIAAIRQRGRSASGQLNIGQSQSAHVASIAVLPFVMRGPGKEGNLRVDGFSEEISTALASVPGLRLIARTSAARLRKNSLTPWAISEELKVQYTVEGSVTQDEEQLRASAHMTETASGAVIWTERYAGTRDDVFDMQERMARAIAAKVEAGLATQIRATGIRYDGSVHAYDCYHRAIQEVSRYTVDGLTRARAYVRNGLTVVGENELLLATMAYVYVQYLELGVKPAPRYLEKASEYASRALRANPRSCLGHVVQGLICYKRGDTIGTVRNLKIALEIDPNHRDGLFWLSLVYLVGGREAAAGPLIVRLLEVDPLTPVNYCLPGYAELLQGNLEGALPHYRRMHRMDTANPAVRWFAALAIARAGRRGEALKLLHQIERDTPHTTFARHARFLKHALERNRDAALSAVTSELLVESRGDQHASWWIASAYALIHEREAALDWLANAQRLGYTNYPFLSRFDPFLASLRADEGFWRLMARIKDAWESFPT